MSNTRLEPAQLIAAAENLQPLLREKAREAEIARRPLDEVIGAIEDTGIFATLVPRSHGGHEADIDTFFEISLIISRAGSNHIIFDRETHYADYGRNLLDQPIRSFLV